MREPWVETRKPPLKGGFFVACKYLLWDSFLAEVAVRLRPHGATEAEAYC